MFSRDGTFVRAIGKDDGSGNGRMGHPYGVAVDGEGYVFVSDFDNKRILIFDQSGEFVGEWGTDVLISPRGIVIDDDGMFYVCDNHEIVVFK